MASRVTRAKLIIPKLDIHHKKAAVKGSPKSFKTATKKGGVGLGSRKALNDITNKSSVHHETTSKKKDLPEEAINIAEECFLHDHNKCIQAQNIALKSFHLDMVLPGHSSTAGAEDPWSKVAKSDLDSPPCLPDLDELFLPEPFYWLASSPKRGSPSSSPISWDSPPSSPFHWRFEEVNFALKPEDYYALV